MHLSGAARAECRPVAAKLGAYVRDGLAKRDAAMVAVHLDQCADCRRIFAELGDVNVAPKAIVPPVVLGPAAAASLASVAAPAASSGHPRPVSLPPPAAPGPSSGASSAPQAPPARPASAPAVAALSVPAVAVQAQGGTSILGLILTVPVVGVQVSANVSLPGGISLGIGGAPGTASAGNRTSAG